MPSISLRQEGQASNQNHPSESFCSSTGMQDSTFSSMGFVAKNLPHEEQGCRGTTISVSWPAFVKDKAFSGHVFAQISQSSSQREKWMVLLAPSSCSTIRPLGQAREQAGQPIHRLACTDIISAPSAGFWPLWTGFVVPLLESSLIRPGWDKWPRRPDLQSRGRICVSAYCSIRPQMDRPEDTARNSCTFRHERR